MKKLNHPHVVKLKEVIEESAKNNMKLNMGKFEFIAIHCDPQVQFPDGKEMKRAHAAIYLGGILSQPWVDKATISATK